MRFMLTCKQGSPEWYKLREGKFTAYDITRLLGKDGLKTTKQSIEGYAFEKAIEAVEPDDYTDEAPFLSHDVQRGKDQEPLAFRKFSDLMLYDFKTVTESGFFLCPGFEDDAGASPDGLVDDDETLEIKNLNKKNFLKAVAFGIEAVDQKFLDQIQMQLLCTGRKRCNLFLYRIHKAQEQWHHLIIERDDTTISLIKERLKIAIKLKHEYIQYLISKKQY